MVTTFEKFLSHRFFITLMVIMICLPVLAELSPAAVVRTAQPIVIDGDPVEWGGIKAEQSVLGRLGQVATFKLAYDITNLYALIEVTDTSPLKNGSGVFQEMLKGGDAISICLGPLNGRGGPQRIMLAQIAGKSEIIAMRPQWKAAGNHPYRYFTEAAGAVPMDDVAKLDGAGAVAIFKPAAKGYRVEVKLPWTALDIRPQADARIPFDLQVIFSDPAGQTNVDTAWWHGSAGGGAYCTTDIATEARLYPDTWATAQFYLQDPGPRITTSSSVLDPAFIPRGLPINFTLPKASKVSVIILDDKGWIVKELLRAENISPGPHTIYWDGHDRWGAPMPAGKYTYRIGYFDGIKASFMGSVGNSAIPPYRTEDGLGSIGGQHYGPVDLAADDKYLYFLNGGEEGQPCLRCVDPVTLKSRWFRSVGTFGMGVAMAADSRYAYMVYNDKFLRMNPANGSSVPFPTGETIDLKKADIKALAVIGDTAYYAVTADNTIGTINVTNGTLGAEISIPAPRGLFKRDADTLLVCSAKQIVAIDLKTGVQTPFLTNLTEPAALTIDADGAIYVSELGTLQQIKKFSADKKLIATFGVAGGRQMRAVPYNPMAFRNITGLTIGPDKHLWMVENGVPPRRFAKLTTDGKLVEDVYGPTRCGATAGCDLDDASTIYYGAPNGTAQFIEAKVDYAAYATSLIPSQGFSIKNIWCLSQNGTDLAATPDLMAGKDGAALAGYNRMFSFTAKNGKRYLWIDGSARTGIWLWEKENWIPVASVSNNAPNTFWADQNGDGLVQPEECSNEKNPAQPSGGWSWLGRDLTLYGINGSLKPASIDERGVPTYVKGEFTSYITAKPDFNATLFDGQSYWATGAPASSENAFYMTENNGPHQNRDFWDRASENRFMKVKDGKVQWIVGRHDGPMTKDGDSIITFGVTGESDGMVIVSDVGSNYIGYTSDGLALGWVLTDANGRTPGVGPNSIYVENAGPYLFTKDAKTGKHLLVSHTTEDVRIMEITGGFGKDITRINGTLNLATTLPRPTAMEPGVMTIPSRTWSKSLYEAWRPTNVDAFDYEWATDLPVLTLFDDKKTVNGEIRMRRDAGNLCIFADILDTNPSFKIADVTNTAGMFGKGSGVELLLGGLDDPQRTAAVAGDTRIFISAIRGDDGRLKAQVLACRPASPAVPPSKELSETTTSGDYRTPGTTTPWDSSKALAAIPGAMVEIRDRYDGRGYVIEAEIPMASMPELTKIQSVSYYHAAPYGQGDDGRRYTQDRSDLVIPLKLNAACWRRDIAGTVTRTPWKKDDFTGTDPRQMDPSNWGVITEPPGIALSLAKAEQPEIPLSYVATDTKLFSFSGGPTVRVENCLFGGGYFDVTGKLTFMTTAPRQGFSLEVPAGGETAAGGNWRTAKLDMTAVGIPPSLTSLVRRTLSADQPIIATLKVSFPAGLGGKLHILWGSYTDNSPASGALSVTDTATGQTIDAAKYPELSFATGFNREFFTCDSVFTIGGTRTLTITLKDTTTSSRACLQGIWIEPIVQPAFTMPVSLLLAAFPGTTLADISKVEFYQEDVKIGEATVAPYVYTWKPAKAGNYTLRAQVTDKLGATATSEPQLITVNAAP